MNVDIPDFDICDECGGLVDLSYRGSWAAHHNFHNDVEELQAKVRELEEVVNLMAETLV